MRPSSWRTTLAGVVTLLGAAAHIPGLPTWLSPVLSGLAEIAAGVGLLLARDNAVSDEQAGAGQVVR